METLFDFVLVISAFMIIELFSAFFHQYVMHGFLWELHKDHHQLHPSILEKNDIFNLFFALMAIIPLMIGYFQYNDFLMFIGLGITFYGIFHFFIHDLMFHRRFSFFNLRPFHPYLQRIINAHQYHHKHSYGKRGVSFGFLHVDKRYDNPNI